MRHDCRTVLSVARTGTVTLLVLLFLPSIACADTPLPSLYGFGAPFFLSITTFGLLIFAILVIEAVVFRLGTGLSWKRAFGAAVIANLFSSVLGLVISGAPGLLILLPGIGYVFYREFVKRWGYSRTRALILGFLPALLSIPWAFLTWPEGRGIQLWTVYVSLVPAFFLSVVIEAVVLRGFVKTGPVWRWVLLANGGSYLLFVVILLATSFSIRDHPMLSPYYLSSSAVSLVKAGEVDRAMELAGMIHEMREPDSPFVLREELAVARVMAVKGYREKAKSILDRVVQGSPELKEKSQDLENDIADVRRILEED